MNADATVNGSYICFTDQNGLNWVRYGGYRKLLVRAKNNTNPMNPPEFFWIGPSGFQPADGCS